MLVHASSSNISGLKTMKDFEEDIHERFAELIEVFSVPELNTAVQYSNAFVDACKNFKFDKVVAPNMLLVYDKYMESVRELAVLSPSKICKEDKYVPVSYRPN